MKSYTETAGPRGPSPAELSARYDSDSEIEASYIARPPSTRSAEGQEPVNTEAEEADAASPLCLTQEGAAAAEGAAAGGQESGAEDDHFSDDEDEEEELMQAMDWADLHDGERTAREPGCALCYEVQHIL